MKSIGSSAVRKKNRVKNPNESDRKRPRNKDTENEDDSTRTGSTLRRKNNEFDFIVSESENEESIQKGLRRKSPRLDISVAETESEVGVELLDMFDEEEKDSNSGEENCLENLASRRSTRVSPRKRQDYYSSNESDNEYFDAFESVSKEKGDAGKQKSPISSSSSDDDKEEVDDVDKAQVYYLKTVLVPLEDIGILLQSYSNGKLTKDCSFSIRKSKTSKIQRQSSGSSSQSTGSSNSDPNDEDFSLSESSISDSEDSSSSGSNFSWESECESLSSSNSWLPRKRYISSSEDDSDSKSDELEEIEDDFVLHTKKNRRELRKKKYLLRRRNSDIRSKVAKHCHELTEESIDSSDE